MAYPDGEALILTKLQSVTGFSATNTSRGKWGLLNSGNSDHYGIIKPGEFERFQIAMAANESRFNTIIQLWQRYKDDGDTLISLETHAQNITAYFDQWRKVADTTGTIVDAFISRGGEVTEQWTKDGGLSWLKQDLVLSWKEHDNVTYAE